MYLLVGGKLDAKQNVEIKKKTPFKNHNYKKMKRGYLSNFD